MDVSVENPGGLQRRLKVQLPPERVEKAVEDKVRRVGRNARIPGFRPGKAPLKVLFQRYGDGARAEVVNELVQSSYPEALEQAEIKPAGPPEVELSDMQPGSGLAFTATVDVYPEIEIKGLDKLKVERPSTEITDADVDKALKTLREQNKTYEPVERASADGDRVTIDFVGRIDGEAFEGGTGNDVEVDLGAERFLPDLERALVGRSAAEEFNVDVAFPDDYGAEDLAGKTATFDVNVKTVAEAQLPAIDDAFLEKLGVADGGEPALRDKLRDSLRRQADEAIAGRVKSQVMEGLHKANPIEVPGSLVSEEIERMRGEAMSRMPQQMQADKEQARRLLPDDSLREGAERRVALGLLLAQVIEDREVALDRERVDAKMDEIAADYPQPDQVKQYYHSNPQLMQGLEAMVMEEQVVDFLLEGAKVKEQSLSLDDLMDSDKDK